MHRSPAVFGINGPATKLVWYIYATPTYLCIHVTHTHHLLIQYNFKNFLFLNLAKTGTKCYESCQHTLANVVYKNDRLET